MHTTAILVNAADPLECPIKKNRDLIPQLKYAKLLYQKNHNGQITHDESQSLENAENVPDQFLVQKMFTIAKNQYLPIFPQNVWDF